MSTNYRFERKLPMTELFDGRLKKYNVEEMQTSDVTEHERCLTDGSHHMWLCSNKDGLVTGFTGRGEYFPIKIMNVISKVFDCEIYSEHEPKYWNEEQLEDMEEEDADNIRKWVEQSKEDSFKTNPAVIAEFIKMAEDGEPFAVDLIEQILEWKAIMESEKKNQT
jgi:hypothetical protein